MRKFALITNAYKDEGLKLTKELKAYIEERQGEVLLLSEKVGDPDQYDEIDFSVLKEAVDCILVLGGDGTLIRLAARVHSYHVPVIGVNLGSLGYLCELEAEQVFRAIDKLLNDDYILEERIMMEGFKENEPKVYGMNDIVIHRAADLSILRMQVYINGEYLATYDADGIIISTPTGSTGYNLSAGGPIVNPKAKLLLMTPINAHSLNARSIVFDSGDCIEVELGTRRYQKDEIAYVSCDGDHVAKLSVGERYQIVSSENKISFCRINKKSFLEILRKKMSN